MSLSQQVIATSFGSPDVLTLLDLNVPSPRSGQLLIKVEAAGVLFGDTVRRADRYVLPTELPYEPGNEVAGSIVEMGKSVFGFEIGDRILCRVPSKGYARYAVVDAANAMYLPEEIEFGAATALLGQSVTAYLLTRHLVALKGKAIFVEAAAGGVGIQVVQLARQAGASVIIGSSSTQTKRDFALGVGVDLAVDLSSTDWVDQMLDATRGKGLDVGYCSSRSTAQRLVKCLAEFGTIIHYGVESCAAPLLESCAGVIQNQRFTRFYLPGYFTPAYTALLNSAGSSLMKLVVSGHLKIHADTRYSLQDAAKAHRALEERRNIGKIVIEPWGREL
ncbi:zinc-binding dehydrogenase [Pseudomonas sp. NFR16]|uniref:quinone oxidoreductase family protein n=1 Tax=Pseudomonas sp. NFR16 TaxID=1566248 RepID=UPI0008C2CF4B|nr:zinc-binding dehydrogenase [Pseudomonas sp. NFR16]SEJ95002.1 NADPH2:quinone reductase [Pseudomonas sp. NFR16]